MIRTTTLTFARNVDAMRRLCKKPYKSVCVVTGLHRADLGVYGPVCGAHIFPSSTHPELAKCLENGLSLADYWHCRGPHSLDAISGTNMPARFRWLVDHVHEDHRTKVFAHLRHLVSEARKFSRKVEIVADEILQILEDI